MPQTLQAAANILFSGYILKQKTTSQEDQEIMDILIAMQKTSKPDWQEQVSILFSQSGNKESELDQDADHQRDIDDDRIDDDCGNSDDEIGDILASQMIVEGADSTFMTPQEDFDTKHDDEKTSWWDVAENEESVSSSNPLSELGSPRIVSQGKPSVAKVSYHAYAN